MSRLLGLEFMYHRWKGDFPCKVLDPIGYSYNNLSQIKDAGTSQCSEACPCFSQGPLFSFITTAHFCTHQNRIVYIYLFPFPDLPDEITKNMLKFRSLMKMNQIKLSFFITALILVYFYSLTYINYVFTLSLTSILFWTLLLPVLMHYLVYGL